jgi:DNA-directed RNA polymerase specialized sigma24 family protein
LRPDPQFVGISDLELLHILCTSDDDQAPYSEFVRRFLPEVKENCKRKCELQKLDLHIGGGIAHEVFDRVRRYKSFKKDRIRVADEHAAVLAYLTKIAGRLFLDHFRQEKRKEEVHETYFDELRQEAKSIDPTRLKDIKNISEGIFKKLNNKEQIPRATYSGIT